MVQFLHFVFVNGNITFFNLAGSFRVYPIRTSGGGLIMRRLFLCGILFGFSLFSASGALAQPFPVTDVRALGMGGAFVAAGEGIGAVQYNPALLGRNTTVSVVVPEIAARIDDHIGLADLVDDLNNFDPADPADLADLIPILDKLNKEGSLDIQGSGAAGAGFGIFGISAGVTLSRTIYGMAMPSDISTNLAEVDDSNFNTLQYGAIDAKQLILSGAKSFGDIAVGANLRSIDATLYYDEQWLFDDPGTGIGDITEGDSTDESTTAIDVGFFMSLLPTLDVGIVGRDVNSPSLGDVDFDPRYRIGAALNLPIVTVAADYDLGENSLEGGTDYKEWAIGGEVDLWAIALRGGLSQNMALSGSPTIIHLGAGLGFLDIGAAYAEGGDYYMAGANLTLGF